MGLNIEPTNANTETSTTNICQLPELRAVDLSWNQISSFRSGDLDQVADKLERLNLRGNRLGMVSFKKSLITIFGHKRKILNSSINLKIFIKKFGISHQKI